MLAKAYSVFYFSRSINATAIKKTTCNYINVIVKIMRYEQNNLKK